MATTKARKPTKSQRERAIAVLAHDPINGAIDLLAAAGCTATLVAGLTPHGSGFTITNRTTKFVRGMVRAALKSETKREADEAMAEAEAEAAAEDAWFEQRNVPR